MHRKVVQVNPKSSEHDSGDAELPPLVHFLLLIHACAFEHEQDGDKKACRLFVQRSQNKNNDEYPPLTPKDAPEANAVEGNRRQIVGQFADIDRGSRK